MIRIGDGLFSSDPIAVESEELGCTLYLHALTAATAAELEKAGVKLDNIGSNKQALIAARSILAKVVAGWEGLKSVSGVEIPFSDENRDRLAEVGDVVNVIIQAAQTLAIVREEEEEKN